MSLKGVSLAKTHKDAPCFSQNSTPSHEFIFACVDICNSNSGSFKIGEHRSPKTEYERTYDISSYPLGWNKIYKENIRLRDGYKCQVCGVPETECKKNLSVHHINYKKNDIRKENLVSLCNRCHDKTNRDKEYWHDFFLTKIEGGDASCPRTK